MSTPKIIQPFAPRPKVTTAELDGNARRWAGILRNELPEGVAGIVILTHRGDVGGGRGTVAAAHLTREELRRELRALLDRMAEKRIES